MGWRFRKSIKIAPGIKINIGKKGISSVSVGPRGAHINVGKNGTNLSTGIPGTGLYNVTRLDKPTGNGMTQCPYCGHRMRKPWDACPKCHSLLVQQTDPSPKQEPIDVTPRHSASDDQRIVDADFVESPPSQKDNNGGCRNTGCGCLVILLILMLIGSCMSGASTKKSASSTSSPPAVTETASSSSKSSSTTTPAPVPVPTAKQDNAATAAPPAKSTPDNEKKYYGDGPNGEGIKGHIDNKKGTRIYHIPGSTYYNRTRNVSQWFFTEREAQAAGYRAPYK